MKYLIPYLLIGLLSMYAVAFRHASFWDYLIEDSGDLTLDNLSVKERLKYYSLACVIAVVIWPLIVVRILANSRG